MYRGLASTATRSTWRAAAPNMRLACRNSCAMTGQSDVQTGSRIGKGDRPSPQAGERDKVTVLVHQVDSWLSEVERFRAAVHSLGQQRIGIGVGGGQRHRCRSHQGDGECAHRGRGPERVSRVGGQPFAPWHGDRDRECGASATPSGAGAVCCGRHPGQRQVPGPNQQRSWGACCWGRCPHRP